MDQVQQKPASTNSCGPRAHPGPRALPEPAPVSSRGPPLICPSGTVQGKQSQVNPPAARDPWVGKSGTGICRPRPTSLGTRPAPRVPAMKDVDLKPLCMPGPHNVIAPGTLESSVPLHSPQSSSLSPNCNRSPGATQVQRERSGGGDNQDFSGGDNQDFSRGDKKDFSGGDNKDFNGGDKKDFSGGDNKDFSGGDKKDFSGGDNKDFSGGDKKDFSGGDNKDFSGGDNKDFSGGDNKDFSGGDNKDFSGGDNKDFRVHIATWNVGSAVPPDDLGALFGGNVSDGSVDMFVVGLQEVNSMINKRLKDALFSDQWSELCMDTLSPSGYVLVASQRMQGVLLLVFSKFCHLPFLRGVQTQSTRTGLGGCWGNKGGVSARMSIFGHPVCFLNCHLPAHMRNLEQRMEDFESILQQQQFEGGAATGVLDHDVVFWFGDLNFRIEDYDIHVVRCAVEGNKLPLLWERDQLNMAKNTESILEGFLEGPLQFPPTYKFDVGTHTYDTSAKKRKPAWTDRVLWRLRHTGSPVPTHNAALQRGLTSWLGGATKVTQHAYRSHMAFTISDHKPVSALFSLHFPFRVDMALVELQVNKEWCQVSDAAIRLTFASNYHRSSWDWVAIYKVGFRHHKDYQAYVWAKYEHAGQVCFPEEDLPREDGQYLLGYYSNNMNSIVALSSHIQIKIPVHSPSVQRSDSTEDSSEDDSTLVLLSPDSRSPSPKSSRHHCRRRSPAVSKPLPSLQGLGLCPRPKETQSLSPGSVPKKERLVSPGSASSPAVSPLSPRSPASPGIGVSAPEALIAALMGEHRPAQVSPTGAKTLDARKT
ncbi:phosphatidylinositol 4,5-bisphosphate 5-phosphatase A [Nerophis ophidion]|uniref:phosphatidylinositol 4,5-bisphosphate 5-phosphatase A n=1 Tax=Nerophis ophidion TaxID=159077 RepID=UPI002ADF5CC6|nr:phosphatidylinositol 4,5-bisphosphate 5-phosphatase A [Nerophis ophidion]